ncbi:DUF4350 domain-containing protein [uncultured Croceitalea sp.]|uniref:DUF4350 domain-containing protein n=1 Tax=uncultured Croceitalea sp. TaxID=1798908 RepID=UPI0033063B79
MDKRSKIILGVFAVVLLGIIISEVTRPRPINWRPSYTADSTVPFGCYVLYNELSTLFSKSTIATVEESIYDVMTKRDTTASSNYLLINDNIPLDQQETNQLLDYVSKGNSVFIAASSFSYFLRDTLNIEIEYEYTLQEDTVMVDLTHQNFESNKFFYSRGVNKSHIVSLDTIHTTILGHIEFERTNELTGNVKEVVRQPNFIKTDFGKGSFFVNTTPEAFSNYYLLKGNEKYVSNAFSYLKDTNLYWDNYKKSGRVVITSPMRFVLNQSALKWSYYLTVVGLLLFVIFKAKREQRIIPVITPLENSSVEFAKTVGSLYHQNKDYTDLITKKLNYFLAHLRNRYYVDTAMLNEKTIQTLAAKSGKPITEVKILLEYILHLNNKTFHTEQELISLNKKITAFKK